ncbi:MAG: CBS domain-containing protein [Nitrososphaerales archaeon]
MEFVERLGKVEDIMSRTFNVVKEDEFLSKVIGMFKEGKAKPTEALIVVDSKGNYKGVLTERMIIRSRLDPKKTKVKTVYRPAPKLNPKDDTIEAVILMVDNDIKHIPVIEDSNIVGLVADVNVLEKAVNGPFGLKPVKDIMTKEPKVIEENASIASAMALMREEGVSRLPVVRGDKLVGIVSIHDIVEHVILPRDRIRFGDFAGDKPKPLSNPVKGVMTKPVITISPNTTLKGAVQLMLEHNIASLIVLDKGRIAGIVTKNDILSAIAQEKRLIKRGLLIQFSFNRMSIDSTEYERMLADTDSFARKYSDHLGEGVITVYFKQHREKWRNLPFIHCRIMIKSEGGQYVGVSNGWGFSNALQNALEHAERQILKDKELKFAEDFIDKMLGLWY